MRRLLTTIVVTMAMLASLPGPAGAAPPPPDREGAGDEHHHGDGPGPLVLATPISAAAPSVSCPPNATHPFADASGSWAFRDIGCIYELEVAAGVGPGSYGPAQPVTREQMAAFLARMYRLLTGDPCTGDGLVFVDSLASFAADDIACLTSVEIANGVSFDRFDPGGLVTREQMAAFLARLYRAATGELCSGFANPFLDALTSFASDAIGCLLEHDIAAGTGATTFDPAAPVTREQMAAFLARVVRNLPPSVMRFVYFVEADYLFDSETYDDIEAMAYDLQQYWYDEFGGTFRLNDPVVDVIYGEHPAAWYNETDDTVHDDSDYWRLGNLSDEVHEELALAEIPPRTRFVVYPSAILDNRVAANFGGAFMDADDILCIGGVTYPFFPGDPAHCLGVVAHEVGHLYDLDHTGADEDCMQFGFYNTFGGSGMCDFGDANTSELISNPRNAGWLDAEPGDQVSP